MFSREVVATAKHRRHAVERLTGKLGSKPLITATTWEQTPVSAKRGYVARIKPRATADAYDVLQPKFRLKLGAFFNMLGLCFGVLTPMIMQLIAVVESGNKHVDPTAFFYGGPAPLVAGGLTAWLFSVSIPTLLAIPAYRKEKLRLSTYREVEAESLSAWLSERYGVSASEEVLGELVTLVHGRQGDAEYEFEDEHGTALKMKHATEHGWFVVENANTRGLHDYQPSGSVARLEAEADEKVPAAVPAEKLLSGEAPVLHEGYQTLLRTVCELDLTAEQQHTVKRVQQDMAATLALLRKAVKLGGPDAEQQAEIVQIIAELITELQELAGEHRAAVTRELRVQRTYLTQRKQPAASLALLAHGEPAVKIDKAPPMGAQAISARAKLSPESEEARA